MLQLIRTRKFIFAIAFISALVLLVGIGFIIFQRGNYQAQSPVTDVIPNYDTSISEIDLLSSELLKKLNVYVGAGESDKSLRSEIVTLGQQRFALIEALAQKGKANTTSSLAGINDPHLAIERTVFPPEAQKSFNIIPELAPYIEANVTLSGQLGRTVTDFGTGLSGESHYLLMKDTTEQSLLFTSTPSLSPSSFVTVRGVRIGNDVLIPGRSNELQLMNVTLEKESLLSSEQAVVSSGSDGVLVSPARTTRVAAVLVNFANKRTEPITVQRTEEIFDTQERSVRAWYQEASKGSRDVTSDIVGYFNLTMNTPSDCTAASWNRIADAAIPLARAELGRVPINQWAILFPGYTGTGCQETQGMADSLKQRLWKPISSNDQNPGSNIAITIAHEIGHNFNLNHAQGYDCPNSTNPSHFVRYSQDLVGCTVERYFDQHDTMGAANGRHFSAVHNEYLGWLAIDQVREVTTNGNYTILPSNKAGTGVRALRIPTGTDANQKKWISVEFRRSTGLFDNFQNSLNSINGLLIREVTSTYSPLSGKLEQVRTTILYSGTPGEAYDPDLSSGDELYLSKTGISIKTVSFTDQSAIVGVTFNPACVKRPPTVTITPTNAYTYPGSDMVRTYQLAVRNNNSAPCGSSNFSVSASSFGQSTLTVSPAPTQLTIAPNLSAASEITVSGTRGTPFGRYEVRAHVSNLLDETQSGDVTGYYWVGL